MAWYTIYNLQIKKFNTKQVTMKKNTITLISLLIISVSAHGQFLKKLGKRVEKAAENTVLKKAEQETSKKTDQALDDVLNMEIGQMGGMQVDPETLPSSYMFDWRYTLKLSHKKDDIKLHYFLSKNGNAFGSRPEMEKRGSSFGNMLMVIDPSRSTTTILIDNEGQKTGMAMSSPDISEEVSQQANMDDYTFKKIGSKEILGYTCQGFQMESEDAKVTMYVVMDAPVSFSNMYSGKNAKHLPKGFNPNWINQIGENSLMMEMDYTDKKNNPMKITYVVLENNLIVSSYRNTIFLVT